MKNRIVSNFCFLACLLMALASPAWAQTINVTNNGDSGGGSLRDAIDQVNAGAAGDTTFSIVFDPGLAGQTIALGATFNPYAPFNVGAGKTVSVNPTGVPVTIDGGGVNRAFILSNISQAATNTTFSFSNIMFANCMAKGGDGGNGANSGGGGAGLGGAIFADTGLAVAMNSCLFNNCSAVGGNSPLSSGTGNGGGGGIGGDGGQGKGGNGGGGGLSGVGGDGASGGASGGGGGIRAGFSTANGGNAPGSSGVSGGFPDVSAGNGGVNGTAGGQDGGGGGGGLSTAGRKGGGGGGSGGMNAATGLGGDGGYGGGGGGGDTSGAGNGGFGGGGGGVGGNAFGNGGFGGGGGGGSVGGTNSGGGGFGGGAGTNASIAEGFGGGMSNTTQGGGGLGAGGAIFVRQGTALTLSNPGFGPAFSVLGGTGYGSGSAMGAGVLLGGNLTLDVSGGNLLELTQDDFLGGNSLSPEAQGGLTKSGMGILILSGVNSYTGGTVVNSGALVVNESIFPGTSATAKGAVTVNNAVLSGGDATGAHGSIYGSVTINGGGNLVPGILGNPGILTITGTTTFAPGGSLIVNLSGPVLGSDYSQIRTYGQIDLANCNLILAGGYAPAVNDTFTIIQNAGEELTLNAFVGLPEGAIIPNFLGTPYKAQISYVAGGSHHDVTLTVLAPSKNANLVNLAASAGPLSPTFAPGTPGYTVNVPSGTTSTTVTASAADVNATIKVNGAPVPSGSPSGPLPLSPGQNSISVVVTAADGVTTNTFSITVTVALSQDASLVSLAIDVGALSPTFASTTLTYSDDVPTGTSSTSVTPTVNDPGATILVNGVPAASGIPSDPIFLFPGPNGISIVVTAADGITTASYSIVVNVALSQDADLADLTIDVGVLTPDFDPATVDYTDDVPTGTASATVRPFLDDRFASATINGMPFTSDAPANPIALVTGPNAIAVQVTAADGVTTKTYTVTVNVAPFIPPPPPPPALPPVITDLSSDVNPSLINTPVTYSFTATDGDTGTLSYSLDFGDATPAVTGSFPQGTSVAVAHTYTSYYSVGATVALTVSDGGTSVSSSVLQVVPMPASGGANVTNTAVSAAPIVSPLDGLGVSVKAADGGVLQLGIDIQSLTRAAYSVSTDWGDAAGRATTVMGTTPVHQFDNRGLYVATTTAVNKDTQKQAGKARITLALSSRETGDYPANTLRPHTTERSAPNNDPGITTKSIKGKFDFSGKKPDLVTYQGTIKLAAGMDLTKPYEFWIALGNIVVETTIVKGKGTAPSVAGVLKSLKITSKVKKGVITVGGELATITVTYSAKGTVNAGFDTEGISDKSTDVTPGGKTPAARKIQVAMLMDGTPFQTVAPVDFTITKNSDFGGMAGRSGK